MPDKKGRGAVRKHDIKHGFIGMQMGIGIIHPKCIMVRSSSITPSREAVA
jgi:hypothetical protein